MKREPNKLKAASVPLESDEPFFWDAWRAKRNSLLFGEARWVEYRLPQQKEKA